MNINVFNVSVAGGWLMFSAGAMMLHLAGGIMAAGLLLLALVLLSARLSGLYQTNKGEGA